MEKKNLNFKDFIGKLEESIDILDGKIVAPLNQSEGSFDARLEKF